MRLHALIAALVIAVSILVAYLMSRALQRQISRPILALAATARAISERRDYSVRAASTGGHELGRLTDAFNQMLTEIQTQHGRLNSQVASLHLLQGITRAIGERQDLPSLLRVVVQSVEDGLPADFACVCMKEGDGQEVTVAAIGPQGRGFESALELVEQGVVPIDTNGLSRCMTGQLVYEPDVRELQFPFPAALRARRVCIPWSSPRCSSRTACSAC